MWFSGGSLSGALEREFLIQDIPFKSQPEVQIVYKGKALNKNTKLIFCYDEVIVEIKAILVFLITFGS